MRPVLDDRVSAHAVLRYAERVDGIDVSDATGSNDFERVCRLVELGVDVHDITRRILTPTAVYGIANGANIIRRGRVILIVRDQRVVTVYAMSHVGTHYFNLHKHAQTRAAREVVATLAIRERQRRETMEALT